MRLLLDTHALIWATNEPGELSAEAGAAIGAGENQNLVSIAGLWEMSIKVNIGKLRLPNDFFENLEPSGYEIIQLTREHLVAYRNLPVIPKHKDPFDRLLVAQAISEGLTIVTRDEKLGQYGVPILKA
jgi:PIN domain nuclease of toxin-antitoxin system